MGIIKKNGRVEIKNYEKVRNEKMDIKISQKSNIVIITPPLGQIGQNFLLELIRIFQAFSGEIYAITDGTFSKSDIFNKGVYIEEVMHKGGKGIVNRIFQYILTQLKISYLLVKKRDADIYVFFLSQSSILPILTLKIMRKKIILAMGGSISELYKSKNDYLLLPLKIIEKISCKLSDHIIIYSENIVKEWNLEKYQNKIYIAHEHFLDFVKFKIKKEFDKRDNLVGYIGRLSEEKGVFNFVKAIPEILKEGGEVKFLEGGDGQLRDKIEKYLDEEHLKDKVKLVGWIPHNKLPDYLNELKLLVLPSYTEGLPNVMLEAMACGTPVLATSVGAIPDIIKDGETGFIMENNSPECIAENVIKALGYPDLERIVKNARKLVEREFTYEATVEIYRKILECI